MALQRFKNVKKNFFVSKVKLGQIEIGTNWDKLGQIGPSHLVVTRVMLLTISIYLIRTVPSPPTATLSQTANLILAIPANENYCRLSRRRIEPATQQQQERPIFLLVGVSCHPLVCARNCISVHFNCTAQP